jgi:hypothetical protein
MFRTIAEISQMAPETIGWWSKRGLGCFSLVLSVLEVAIVWGVVGLLQTQGSRYVYVAPKVAGIAWHVGGLVSFALGLAGLFVDSDRRTAVFAVIFSLAAFAVCAFRSLVFV